MNSTPDEDLRHEPGGDQAPPPRRSWTARVAPLILVAGAMLAGNVLFKRLPKEREIELRLDDAASVVQVDLTWADARSRHHDAQGEPIQGSTYRFAEGAAPKSVLAKVRLPDGPYNLEISVDRTSGRATTRRAVTLGEADRIAFQVR